MMWWSTGRKGAHDHEAGSSSGRRRAASSTPPPRRAPAPPAFTIAPPAAPARIRQYVPSDVCRRYWETGTPLPWADVHLPNNSHLSADRVPIPLSGRARREEIHRRCRHLPDDLYDDDMYAVDSPLWDT